MVHVIHNSPTARADKDKKAQAAFARLQEDSIEEYTARLAKKHHLRYLDLGIFPVENESVILLPKEDATRLGVALFQKEGQSLRIALTNPEDADAIAFLTNFAKTLDLQAEFFLVSRPSIERAWNEYEKRPLIENLDLMHVTLKGADLEKFEADFGALLEIKNNVSKIPTTRVLEIIIAGAYKLRSSDIHFEPLEDSVRLRYRIDGILQEIGQLPQSIYQLALSRIKMLSKMKLNVRDRSQDGHFFSEIKEKRVDIRVNIIPSNHGESVNMRLLTGEEAFVPIEELGLRGRAHTEIKKGIKKPFGMILNTGPTGSGKTTTLYSLLNSVNNKSLKIITIEDPIEYVLPGIVQTEVSKNKDYTFAQGLRAIVRQDPDIILVGEIRDEETADIALNAALTGHLVFSTLHTNNAAASIARLLELGAKPTSITAGVALFIAQRLVRILCPHCKASYVPARKTVEAFLKILSFVPPLAEVPIPKDIPKLYKPVGCSECSFTGYRGRKGIFEVFPLNEKIGKLINASATETEIRSAAIEDGMMTMSQDGILKVIDGVTTVNEVWRSAGKEESLQGLYDDILSDDGIQETLEKTADNVK